MRPSSILVTGSAGFIGGNFVRVFKREFPQTALVGLDIRESKNGESVFYRGSITDPKLLDAIFTQHKPEYVFHFAAIPRVTYSVLHLSETTEVNVYGTTVLLEKSRDHGVKRFIFSSSSSVYGGAKKLPTKESENPPNPQSPYAAHKYVCEIFCRQAAKLYGMDALSLRYFNVYGPGQYGNAPYSTVISAWLEALYFPNGEKPYLEGDGDQSRDFSYVDDVVAANIAAMRSEKRFDGDVFNIGAQSRTDLRTVKRLIEQHTGKTLDLDLRPPRIGDVQHTFADISKASERFGFKPAFSFEAGLSRTVDWFKNRTR